jgi:hypothetical protein
MEGISKMEPFLDRILLNTGIVLLGAGVLGVSSVIPTSEAQAEVAVCFTQPAGKSPIPCPANQDGSLGGTPPSASGLTSTTVACGSTSTAFGVTGTSYLHVHIPINAGGTIGFGWGTLTATLAPPSEIFAPGTDLTFAGGTGNCISNSGTTNITVLTE